MSICRALDFSATFLSVTGFIINDMNDKRDPLDALLREIPAPSTPPWFAAKTVARLRRERRIGSGWRWLRWAVPVSACVLALLLVVGTPHQPAVPPRVAIDHAVGSADDELVAALEEFVAYVEEQDQWPLELAGSSQLSW